MLLTSSASRSIGREAQVRRKGRRPGPRTPRRNPKGTESVRREAQGEPEGTPKGPRRIQTDPEGTQRTPKGTQRGRKPEKTDENPLSSALPCSPVLSVLSPVLSSSSVLSVLSSALQYSPALQCSQCSPVLSVLSSALQCTPALQCSPVLSSHFQDTFSKKLFKKTSRPQSHCVALNSAPVCTRMYILGFTLVYIYIYLKASPLPPAT